MCETSKSTTFLFYEIFVFNFDWKKMIFIPKTKKCTNSEISLLAAWRKAPWGEGSFRFTGKWLWTESRSGGGLHVQQRLLRAGSCFQQGGENGHPQRGVGVSVMEVEPEKGFWMVRGGGGVVMWPSCGWGEGLEADHIFGVLGRPFCGAAPT